MDKVETDATSKSRQERVYFDECAEVGTSEDIETTSETTTDSWTNSSPDKCHMEKIHIPIDEPVSFNSLAPRVNKPANAPASNNSRPNSSSQLLSVGENQPTNGENDQQACDEKPTLFKYCPDDSQTENDVEKAPMGTHVSPDEEGKLEASSTKKKKHKRKKRGGGETKEVDAQGCCESQCEESCRSTHCHKEKPLGNNFVPQNNATYSMLSPCREPCCGGNYGVGASVMDNPAGAKISGKKTGKKKKSENVIKAREIEGNRGSDDVDTLVGFVEGKKKGGQSEKGKNTAVASLPQEKKTKKQKVGSRAITTEVPLSNHNGESAAGRVEEEGNAALVQTPPAQPGVAKKDATNGSVAPAVKEALESAPTATDLEFTNFEGLAESQEEQPFEKYVGRKKKPRAPAPRQFNSYQRGSRWSGNGFAGPRGGRQSDT